MGEGWWVGIRVVQGIIISSGGWVGWGGKGSKDLGGVRHSYFIRWVGMEERGKVGRHTEHHYY